MEYNEKKLSGIILSIVIIGILIGISLLIFNEFYHINPDIILSKSETLVSDYLVSNSLIETPENSIATVKVYNQTWLDFDGVNDKVDMEVLQSKSTISLWFKNDTYDWLSIINSGSNIYINNILNTTWTGSPYYIDGDNIYLGKTDAITFVKCSIDEFRVYEQELNISEVGEVYSDGR